MRKASMTIADVLARQVEQILPSREGLAALMKKRKIRLYFGVEPTGADLHLGHAIPLRKLRQFQELGHETILLLGTFTALIGDPSEREAARKPLTPQQVKENIKTYKKQAGKILDLSKTKILHNAEWLGELKPQDFLRLASSFTVSQLLERDMFQRRMQKGDEVWVNEFLYPLMQGYDSVAMDVDLEIGATDQTFNMLVGRRLQKLYHQKEKFILTTPLLLGLDGRKMSKSYGNTVNILDPPEEVYGKLMSMKDELIPHFVEMCTEVPLKEFKGLPARDAKAKLAKEVVRLYHGQKAAQSAEQQFDRVFRAKQVPQDVPMLAGFRGSLSLVELVTKVGFAASKAEGRRLIEQGGIKIDGKAQKNPNVMVQPKKGMMLQAGKRRFAKIG